MEQRVILFNIISLSKNYCPIKTGKKYDSQLCVGKCSDNTAEENESEFQLEES